MCLVINFKSLCLIIILIVVILLTTIFALYKYSFKIETVSYTYKDGKCFKNEIKKINGFKIIFFSDLHLGRLLKKKELIKIINELAMLNGDLYIFGGDLVGYNIKKYYSLKDIEECFLPLKDKTCLAVFGNHEFKKHNKIANEEIRKYYQSANFKILEDDIYNFNGISIYGLRDGITYPLKYNHIKDNSLVILHEGDFFDNLSGSFLMLSGHSHGKQINIPLGYTPKKGKKYIKGLFKSNMKYLIVSKGLGCNLFKMRFFAKCDIIVIDYEMGE